MATMSLEAAIREYKPPQQQRNTTTTCALVCTGQQNGMLTLNACHRCEGVVFTIDGAAHRWVFNQLQLRDGTISYRPSVSPAKLEHYTCNSCGHQWRGYDDLRKMNERREREFPCMKCKKADLNIRPLVAYTVGDNNADCFYKTQEDTDKVFQKARGSVYLPRVWAAYPKGGAPHPEWRPDDEQARELVLRAAKAGPGLEIRPYTLVERLYKGGLQFAVPVTWWVSIPRYQVGQIDTEALYKSREETFNCAVMYRNRREVWRI